jgi:hypothetical protein
MREENIFNAANYAVQLQLKVANQGRRRCNGELQKYVLWRCDRGEVVPQRVEYNPKPASEGIHTYTHVGLASATRFKNTRSKACWR